MITRSCYHVPEMNATEAEAVVAAVREQGAKGLLPDISEFMSNRDRGKAMMNAAIYRRVEHKDRGIVLSLFSRDKRPDKSHSVSYLYLFRRAMINNDVDTADAAAKELFYGNVIDAISIDQSGIPWSMRKSIIFSSTAHILRCLICGTKSPSRRLTSLWRFCSLATLTTL